MTFNLPLFVGLWFATKRFSAIHETTFLTWCFNCARIFQEARLLTLIEGVLAANIFDWGSRACVDLYHKGTIIEIYRMSRNKMQRPWRVRDKTTLFPR